MTEPKKVSDFAKEYQQTYIALASCESAYKIVFQERDRLKAERSNLIDCLKNIENLLYSTDDKTDEIYSLIQKQLKD